MQSSCVTSIDIPLTRNTPDEKELKSVVAEALDQRLEAFLCKEGGLVDRVESLRALLHNIESRLGAMQAEGRSGVDSHHLPFTDGEGLCSCAAAVGAGIDGRRPTATTAAGRGASQPSAQKTSAGKTIGSWPGHRARDMTFLDNMHTDHLLEGQGLIVTKKPSSGKVQPATEQPASRGRAAATEQPASRGRAAGGVMRFARLLPTPSLELPSPASTAPDLLRYMKGQPRRPSDAQGSSEHSTDVISGQASDNPDASTKTGSHAESTDNQSRAAAPEKCEAEAKSPKSQDRRKEATGRAQNFCRLGSFPFPFLHSKDNEDAAESRGGAGSNPGSSRPSTPSMGPGGKSGSSRPSAPSGATMMLPEEREPGTTTPPVAPNEPPPDLAVLPRDLILFEGGMAGGEAGDEAIGEARSRPGSGKRESSRNVQPLPEQLQASEDHARLRILEANPDSKSEDGLGATPQSSIDFPINNPVSCQSTAQLRLLPAFANDEGSPAYGSETSSPVRLSRDNSPKTSTTSIWTPPSNKKVSMDRLRVQLEKELVENGTSNSPTNLPMNDTVAVQDAGPSEGKPMSWLHAQLVQMPMALVRLYGLLPVGTGRLWLCYKNIALAVVILLLFHSLVLALQDPSMMYVHMLTTCYALGGLVGVVSLRWHSVSHLEAVMRLLDQYAIEYNFVREWLEVSWHRFLVIAALWALMVACRVGSEFDSSCESLGEVDVLELLSFSVISGLLAVLTFCQIHVCCMLELIVDKYVVRLTDSLDLHRGIMEWNIVQALLRRASHTVDSCFLALNTAVLATLLLTGVELLQQDASNHIARPEGTRCGALWFGWAFTPVILVLFTIFQAAAVTEKCSRVPAMVNSWSFGQDYMDHGRQYLVQYIMHSAAGFYVKGVRLSAFMALKLAYIFGVVLFTSVTQHLLQQL